jgi:hypothetical protein
VFERFLALARGGDQNAQIFLQLILPDKISQANRAKRRVYVLVRSCLRGNQAFL